MTPAGSAQMLVRVVMGVDHPTPGGGWRRVARAFVAYAHDKHLGAYRLEAVSLLEVRFQLGDQLLLDVHPSSANKAGDVVAGLDRKAPPGFGVGLRAGVEARTLVAREAHPMTDAIKEPTAVTAGLDHLAGRGVHVSRGYAWANSFDSRVMGTE